jgi:hypothetical protein
MPSPSEADAFLADKLGKILLQAQKKLEPLISVYDPKFKITGIGLQKVLLIKANSPSAGKAIHKICSHAGIPLSYRHEHSFVSVTLENKKNINHVLKIMTDGFDSDEENVEVDIPDDALTNISAVTVLENVHADKDVKSISKKTEPAEPVTKVSTPVVPDEPLVVLPVKNENSDNNQQLKTNDNMAKLDSLKKAVYAFLKANKIGHISVIPNKKNPFCATNLKTAEDQKLFEKKAKQAQLSEFIELSGEKVVRVFEGFTFTAEDEGPADGPTSTKGNVKKKTGKVSKNKKTTTTSPGPATLLSLVDEWQADKEKIENLTVRVQELEEEKTLREKQLKKFEEFKKKLKDVL